MVRMVQGFQDLVARVIRQKNYYLMAAPGRSIVEFVRMAEHKPHKEVFEHLKNSEPLVYYDYEQLVAYSKEKQPNPLDIEKVTRFVIWNMSYAQDKLKYEVLALPIHLQETMAFFISFQDNNCVMNESCQRPEGLPKETAAYPTCSCKGCLDVYHKRWAEAEERHWNIMNRFLSSSNYYFKFMDAKRWPYIDAARRKIDFGALPVVPAFMRFYGIKQNMVLRNFEGGTKEITERTLIILKENKEDQIKVIRPVIQ